MRTESKRTFRPSLERFEARIVAAAGVASAAAHHVAPHPAPHHAAQVESHHESPKQQHPAPHPAAKTTTTDQTITTTITRTTKTTTKTHQSSSAPKPSLPTNTTTNQAWVEIVNTTGEDLSYQIKLGPYANGQFLTFDIAAGTTQYRYSSLISNGQRVNADFAIQFGNGPVTPLMTGISQSSAQGYYIFLDNNFQPYVEPFINS